MRIKEIHEILQNLKQGKVTQNDIARAIGTSRANVSKLFSKNSYINDEKIQKIEEYFSVELSGRNKTIIVNYYPGDLIKEKNGTIFLSDKYVKCSIPPAFFTPKKECTYIMCHANDNSMQPVIMSGDFIIIEKTSISEISSNKIYAFIYDGEFYVRRLSNNIKQYVVTADNNIFQTQYINKNDTEKFMILGRVVYVGRMTDFD